ncbi:expressed unknown protein [Seminavis robusta]|uniref:Major facilitator superfamily associated domain-containing protein n=1 Tax=Seminavis robusta TaxID=568900 RepID=A0A9N8EKQ1_9STRA|nr:expressed unknown protein [Seminavis robusta]|eukprot:Sro1087_g239850.1 n/a (669) ;mRNA; f:21572-23834
MSESSTSLFVMLWDSLRRPRVLYSSIYAWISVTGGRFLAPFLRNLGLSDTEIGVALALQLAIMTCIGPWAARVTEALESEYPGRGRAQVLTTGIIYATMEYLMNALDFENKNCYVALCGLYTVGVAMVFPALDGMTNDFLERSDNPDEDLARERLYGAIIWAFTNLYMSMALDWYGFNVTYPMAAICAVAVLFSICIYSTGQFLDNNEDIETNVNMTDVTDLKKPALNKPATVARDPGCDDDSHHSDAHTATTAPTHQDSEAGEMSLRSILGSDMSSVTERSMDTSAFHDACSVAERSVETDDGNSMDSSIRTSDVTEGSLHKSSGMDTSVKSVSRSASFIMQGRKPLSTRAVLEEQTQRDIHKRKTEDKARRSKKAAGEEDDDGYQSSLGEEYLLVFQAMTSSCYGCAFLFLYLSISAGQSMVDNLIFLYFEEMGASYLIMGYTIVITIIMELSVSYVAPKLLTVFNYNVWLVIAGLAYIVRVIGYTMIPRNHIWMIWVLELLHGLTFAGTLTAMAEFAAVVVPYNPNQQATLVHLVSLLRGKAMTAAVFWGALVQQEVGPKYMYRRYTLVVILAVLSFGLALLMDFVFSVDAVSENVKPQEPKSRFEGMVTDEELARSRCNSVVTEDGLFQDPKNSDFGDNYTISWDSTKKRDDGTNPERDLSRVL